MQKTECDHDYDLVDEVPCWYHVNDGCVERTLVCKTCGKEEYRHVKTRKVENPDAWKFDNAYWRTQEGHRCTDCQFHRDSGLKTVHGSRIYKCYSPIDKCVYGDD